MTKPTIITIKGPMASGKSTITNKLEKILENYHFIDRAHIKNVMLKKLENRELASKLSKDAVFLILKGLLISKENILLQEIMTKSLKKHLKKEIKGYRIKSFYLDCSLETSQKRDVIRRPNKKIRPEIVAEMHRKNAHPEKEDIIINTETNSINEVIKKIKQEIK